MTNITKEGIEVKPSQIWRDLNKWMTNRQVKVLDVSDGRATVRLCISNGNPMPSLRQTKLSISRMHKSSTGWELVKEV